MGVKYRRKVVQSEEWHAGAQWVQPSGVGVDFTGWTGECTIATAFGATPLIVVTTTPSGGNVMTMDASGNYDVKVVGGTTASWPVGDYVYNIFVISPSGARTPLEEESILSVRPKV